MRIGILTLPLHTNFGGILQAVALRKVLTDMGHEVWLLDGKMYSIDTMREHLSVARWMIMQTFGLKKEKHPQLQMRERMKELIPFIEKWLPLQKSPSDVRESDFDAIVVGSDQVWRGLYSNDLTRYFLDFTQGWNIKRIAWAASFGVDNWTADDETLNKCKELVTKFDFVSTREKSGVDICKNQLGYDKAQWVVDPTMLLTADEWRLIGGGINQKSNHSIVTYILDDTPEIRQLVDNTARDKKLPVINLRMAETAENHLSVYDWLSAIANAEMVITDSFHGSVFSLLFHRPLIITGNRERGMSRFESLLEVVDLLKGKELIKNGIIVFSKHTKDKINDIRLRCLPLLDNILNE